MARLTVFVMLTVMCSMKGKHLLFIAFVMLVSFMKPVHMQNFANQSVRSRTLWQISKLFEVCCMA